MLVMTHTPRVFVRIKDGIVQLPRQSFEEVIISQIFLEYPDPNLDMLHFTSVIDN